MTGSPRRLLGRLRRAASTIGSAADAILFLRMVGWALALRSLKVVMPIRSLVRLMASPSSARLTGRTRDRVVELADLAHRAAGMGLRENCLERSLIIFRYLGGTESSPHLVVGAKAGQGRVEGHVWVTVGEETVYHEAGHTDEYVPVTSFAADGTSLSVAAGRRE